MVPANDELVAASTPSKTTTDRTVAGSDNSRSPSSRPTSSHTLHSTFADSAVDMDATTPTEVLDSQTKTEVDYFEPASPPTTPPIDQTLSEKMRQLTAVAWTSEQDETMTVERRETLKSMLKHIEAYLEPISDKQPMITPLAVPPATEELTARSQDVDPPVAHAEAEDLEGEDDEWIDESELIAVRNELAATVQEMRLRHEEQRHLHQLTVHKLEAVAQRCLAQERQADDLLHQVRELRLENHTIGQENDRLREQLAQIEAEAAHKDVAVHAMSSAVAGLEGWIESAHVSRPQTPVVEKKPKRQRVVIRGKGRFRGRYYVDEDGDHAVAYSLADAAAESQELHDGVKAWLRGFRDVEEELRQHESPARSRAQSRFQSHSHLDEDEWGDFQSADSFR